MKKYRVLFLVLTLFFISGCSFEYNINVDSDFISENNIIYMENTTSNNIQIIFENLVSEYTGPTNSLGMYSSSIVRNGDLFGVSYNRDYNYSEYNYSPSFSLCYDNYKLIEEDDKLIIATSGKFNCFNNYKELDEVVVNLISDYHVEESNADVVDDNKYTWYITKANASNKPINITIDLNEPVIDNNDSWLNSFTLMIIALVVIGLVVLLIYIINKKNNKI